jgi:hypothetical protein
VCSLLEQKLEFTTVDAVAVHDESDQGIVYQLGERAPVISITSLRAVGPRNILLG